MTYKIENGHLKVAVSSHGAELSGIMRKSDSYEVLHRGDMDWSGSSPILFPFIGRFQDKKCRCGGKERRTDIHGFARNREFALERKSETAIEFSYRSAKDDPYPWLFKLHVAYSLDGNKLVAGFRIENRSETAMWSALGLHPGFVPTEVDGSRLEFGGGDVDEYIMTDSRLWSGHRKKADGAILITHGLFDRDARIYGGQIFPLSYKNRDGSRIVDINTDDFGYLTVWHKPMAQSRYVCVEPCSSIPGREGVIEDIESMPGYERTEPNGVSSYALELEF